MEVARDDVAGGGRRPADGVALGPEDDVQAVVGVGHGQLPATLVPMKSFATVLSFVPESLM